MSDTRKIDTLLACVAVTWACSVLIRDLIKNRNTRAPRKGPSTVTPRSQRPISVDEFHTIRWEIEHEKDIVERARQEGSS